MPSMRVVLTGPEYREPRYYGQLEWSERDVYLRHPGGGKDSRHRDGATYLTSDTTDRTFETRCPTSDIFRETVNFIQTVSDKKILKVHPRRDRIIARY